MSGFCTRWTRPRACSRSGSCPWRATEKTPLRLPADFVDLLTELERSGVRYVLLGGYAVGFHDRPRTTKDLDLPIDSSARNIERATQALCDGSACGSAPSR